jgi:hypothetical protein
MSSPGAVLAVAKILVVRSSRMKRGILRRGGLLASCALLVSWPGAASAGTPSLTHAQALYQIHDADGAESELRALLTHKLSARVAATAHVYLGMLALEARSDTEGARAEMLRALKLDPNVSMPLSASPEVQQLFARVHDEHPGTGTPHGPNSPLPPEAMTEPAPAAAVAQTKPAPSHGPWPWVLGAAALVAVGVSVWGFLQVAADNSAAAQSRTQPVSLAQAQSAVAEGQLGQDVGISAAVAAAALGVGAGLTW